MSWGKGPVERGRFDAMQRRAEMAEAKLKDALNDSDQLCEQFNEISRSVRNAFDKVDSRWPDRGRHMTLEEMAKCVVQDLLRLERLIDQARKRKAK